MMNPVQMMILESYASIKSEEELKGLNRVLKNFYAQRLDAELDRLWDDGTLDDKSLKAMRHEHFRTPYRQ